MSVDFKLSYFLLFFNLLLFLVFLFAESHLGLYVIGLFSIFLLFFRNRTDFSQLFTAQKFSRMIIILWLIFLVMLVINVFQSHSISHSLNKVFFFIFSFTFMSFLLSLKKSFYHEIKINILKSLVFQSLYLSVLSLFFLLLPKYGDLLPSMNLIYSSFGHNHLSALLVMVIPISWYFSFKPKKNHFYLFSSIFLTLALLLSFGRTTVIIGLLQFLAIFFIFLKTKVKIPRKIIFVILSSFLLLISIFLFSSLNKDYSDFNKCPFTNLYRQLCKPIHYESRPSYWAISLTAIKNYTFFGYGLGTFEFLSNKYRENYWEGTGYAHNAFLQMFAETGIITGSIFLILMFAMLVFPIFSLHTNDRFFYLRDKNLLQTTIIISLLSIYLNVLMDFDWNFLGIYLITLLLLAVLNREQGAQDSVKIRNIFFSKKTQLFLSFLLIFFSLLYLLIDLLLVANRPNQAFKIFPYFQYHQYVFLQNPSLKKNYKEVLSKIYLNDSKFYEQFLRSKYQNYDLAKLSDYELNIYFYEMDKLCKIDKVSCDFWRTEIAKTLQHQADMFIEMKEYDLAEKNLILVKKLKRLDYWELNQLGNFYLKIGKIDQAQVEFETCLQEFSANNHGQINDDCQINLEIIKNDQLHLDIFGKEKHGLDRYEQVSKIIRGEAKWQDFQ